MSKYDHSKWESYLEYCADHNVAQNSESYKAWLTEAGFYTFTARVQARFVEARARIKQEISH